MRPATAQIVLECGLDLRGAGMRGYVEQRLGREDEAADAVAALCCLFLNEGSLQRMRVLRRAQTFDRRNFPFADVGERKHARVACFPSDQDRASPACTVRAAHFRAGQTEALAKHQYQRHLRISIDAMPYSVHHELTHRASVAISWENGENGAASKRVNPYAD